MNHRVVITGIGVIAPNGGSTDVFWKNCLAGKASVGTIPEHWREYSPPVSTLWAPLPMPDDDKTFVNRVERMQLDKTAILALGACRDALMHAEIAMHQADEKKNTFSLEGVDGHKAGVFIGTGMGGITSFAESQAFHILGPLKERTARVSEKFDPDAWGKISALLRVPPRFNPFSVSMVMPNASAAALGIKLNLSGPNHTCCQACAAGAFAIGEAYRSIHAGNIEFAIAGGTEYLGDDFGGIFHGFDIAKTLVRHCNEPDRANRPFDKQRSGFLFAEGGAAVLILESLDRAFSRGAPIIAEIAGFSESFDAHSLMAVDPSGQMSELMIRDVLAQARINPEEIDYINAHATGTELNDGIEAGLISRIFGKNPLVNATKSLTGHPIGAAGAIEAAVTALSIHHQTTHACRNLEEPVADLNFVRSAAAFRIRYALTQSFAFGGHNAALVMRECK